MVKVNSESEVNGGKWKMEKMSPHPCTITIPPSKTCTTGTTPESLGVSLVEDNSQAGILCKRTVNKKVVRSITEGVMSVRTVAGQVGELAAESAVITNAAVLGVSRGMLVATRALILRTVDAKMPCGVALKTTSLRCCDWLWAQAGISRCNLSGVGGHSSLMKHGLRISGYISRDIEKSSSGGLQGRNRIFQTWSRRGGMWHGDRQSKKRQINSW